MKNEILSIIIPCYNCEATLREALESVYKQDLDISFEVILVDDCSTDNTRKLILDLSMQHKNMKYYFHEKNRGGGATRNTAIKNTIGDVIFCLDSDDVLPPGTLMKMFTFLKEKKCDGVGIHRSKKFNGTDVNDIAVVHTFGYVNERVPFYSLIEKKGVDMNPLYSTFMITRKAFNITGGYPEDNGFDTQSFAWKFLANGQVAYTCPDAEYLHRINFHKSYYVREAESGKINLNWFKIFDEFLFLFNDDVKKKILSFKFNDYSKNIYDSLKKINSIFVTNIEFYIRPHTKELMIQEIEKKEDNKRTTFELYWLGSEYLRKKDFLQAEKILLSVKEKGFNYPVIDEKLYVCRRCLDGANYNEEIQKIEAGKQKMVPGWKIPLKFVKNFLKKIVFLREVKKLVDATLNRISERSKNKRFFFLYFNINLLLLRKLFRYKFTVKDFDIRPVDIVIVTTSKDYSLLEKYLEALRLNVCQKINKIFLVSHYNNDIINFCELHNIKFIDELKVLGYGKENINYNVHGVDRRGWMFQQLLKLSGEKFVELENYIIIDSDTLLINKTSFLKDGKYIFFENEEWVESYFKSFERMFGYETRNRLSFTSHMMIFNTRNLALMKTELEKKHGISWDKVYLSNIDEKKMSCVSDYDTYANWVLYNLPEKVITEPLYNTSLDRAKLPYLHEMIEVLRKKYKTISFHSYIKN